MKNILDRLPSLQLCRQINQAPVGSLISWMLPLILAVAIGLITIDGKFVYDDEPAIRRNPLVTGEAPYREAFSRDFWGTPIEQGITSWRPLTPMLWRLMWTIRPDDPKPFRAVSLMLHVTATALVLIVGRRVLPDQAIPVTAACLFAVHAIHSEAIGGIVSHADLLATVLGLLSLNIVLGGMTVLRGLLLTVTLVAACLAKESAIIFCVTIFILSFTLPERSLKERICTLIPAIAVMSGLVSLQLLLPRNPVVFAWYNNISLGTQGMERIIYGFYTIGRSIAMSFVPVGLAPYHNYASVDLSMESLLPHAIPGAAFLIMGGIGLCWSIRKRNTTWIIGLCLLFGPPLLQSNLVMKIMTDVTERLLYPTSIASCAIMTLFIHRVLGAIRLKTAAYLLLVVLLLAQSWRAQRPWRDFHSLASYAIEVEPLCWRAHCSLGIALMQKNKTIQGLWHMMVGKYILSQYPGAVDMEPFRKLADIPLPQRFIEAPEFFDPKAPCFFAVEFLYLMRDDAPGIVKTLLPLYVQRYGECITTTLDSLGNNGPNAIYDRIPRTPVK